MGSHATCSHHHAGKLKKVWELNKYGLGGNYTIAAVFDLQVPHHTAFRYREVHEIFLIPHPQNISYLTILEIIWKLLVKGGIVLNMSAVQVVSDNQ